MDILSNLGSLLGQGAAGNNQTAAGGGGMFDPNMLGGLVGALFSGKPGAPAQGAAAQGGGDMGGLGSLLGSLMGSGSTGGASSGGGMGGLLGSLLGGEAQNVPPPPVPKSAPARSNENYATNMLRAMVYAARADGKINQNEQAAIQKQVNMLNLGNEAQAFIDQAFKEPLNPKAIAQSIATSDEAMNIYAMTCAVTGLDDPREVQYAKDLAAALGIPAQVQQAIQRKLLG